MADAKCDADSMLYDGQLGMEVDSDAEVFRCCLKKLERYRYIIGCPATHTTVKEVLQGLVDGVKWTVDGEGSETPAVLPEIFVRGGIVTHVRLI